PLRMSTSSHPALTTLSPRVVSPTVSSAPVYSFSCSAHPSRVPSVPTRRSSDLGYITGVSKTYLATIRLGSSTPTDDEPRRIDARDRNSTRLNSSHVSLSYAVFCWRRKNVDDVLGRRNDAKHNVNRIRELIPGMI